VNTIGNIMASAMDEETNPPNQLQTSAPQKQQQIPAGTNINMSQEQVNQQTADLRKKAEDARAAAAYYEQ